MNFRNMVLGMVASTVLLTSFAFLPLVARAQEEIQGPPEEVALVNEEVMAVGPGEECCEPWAEKLGLSDEQMERLVSLKSEYMAKTAPQKAEMMADMKQMMLLMTASSLDKSAIMSLHDKMAGIHSDLCAARVNHMMDAMNVLTSKQREDLHHRLLVHMVDPHHMHGHADMSHHKSFEHHHGG